MSQVHAVRRNPFSRLLGEAGIAFLCGLIFSGAEIGSLPSPLPLAIAGCLSSTGAIAVLIGTLLRYLMSGKMWFLLPDDGVAMDDLLADEQTMEFLNSNGNWENSKHLIVNMSVPKFDVVSDLDLRDGLNALGITGVFDATVADFSPMTSKVAEIFLSKADHAARVAIDEEGVTAAAYTVMMMAGAAAPPEEEMDFVLDRPFLFAITGADGLPLFVGVVNRP